MIGVICLFLMYRIVSSHYGYALRGIHDNEKRMQALGYNTWLYKYTSWIVAGVFGGIAGVLFAYFGYARSSPTTSPCPPATSPSSW